MLSLSNLTNFSDLRLAHLFLKSADTDIKTEIWQCGHYRVYYRKTGCSRDWRDQ